MCGLLLLFHRNEWLLKFVLIQKIHYHKLRFSQATQLNTNWIYVDCL